MAAEVPPPWKANHAVKHCRACRAPFSLFSRKHHCRACGDIFCDDCSRYRAVVHRGDSEPSRVCVDCLRRLQGSSTPSFAVPSSPSSSPAAAAVPRVLYHSRSLCARCSFVERRGFALRPSVVFAAHPSQLPTVTAASLALHRATLTPHSRHPAASELSGVEEHCVYLGVCCPLHSGEAFVLLCSDLPFFLRQWTFDHPPSGAPSSTSALTSLASRSLDLEDLASATQYRSRSSPRSLPLLLELSVYREERFLSTAEVEGQLASFVAHYPVGHHFVLKVNGGLISRKADMEALNARLQAIHRLTQPHPPPSTQPSAPPPPSFFPPALLPRLLNLPIVVDLTFDRLIDLALLPSSVLLRANVLPCVRYFLASTDSSEAFIADMSALLNALHTIQDISLLLVLTLDDPPPSDLPQVMDFLQAQHRIVRMVVLTRERSPALIFEALLSPAASSPSSSASASVPPAGSPSAPPPSTDVFALLRALEAATHGRVHPSDFVPFRVLSLLAPLLPQFGWGLFHPNASPLCLSASLLVNTPTLRSIPLSHLFDLHRLYHALRPLAERLAKGESLGVLQAASLQRAIKACLIARIDVPDVLAYLTSRDELRVQRLRAFMRSTQLLVLHNKMDLASVDMQRRCECAVVETSPIKDGEWIAACTGCV